MDIELITNYNKSKPRIKSTDTVSLYYVTSKKSIASVTFVWSSLSQYVSMGDQLGYKSFYYASRDPETLTVYLKRTTTFQQTKFQAY